VPGAAPPTVLCLHESATTGAIWSALTESLDSHATVVAPDRPGWGGNEAPEGYARTTIAEQAGFAASALSDRGPAVVCGAGIGAVVALELSFAEPDLVTGIVLIEPPLLSFVPEATDRLSADVGTLRDTVKEGGKGAALDAYLAGRLSALGPGAQRIPRELADRRPEAATALFACWALLARGKRRASRPLLRTSAAAFAVGALLIGLWAVWQGGVPEFSDSGLI